MAVDNAGAALITIVGTAFGYKATKDILGRIEGTKPNETNETIEKTAAIVPTIVQVTSETSSPTPKPLNDRSIPTAPIPTSATTPSNLVATAPISTSKATTPPTIVVTKPSSTDNLPSISTSTSTTPPTIVSTTPPSTDPDVTLDDTRKVVETVSFFASLPSIFTIMKLFAATAALFGAYKAYQQIQNPVKITPTSTEKEDPSKDSKRNEKKA